MSCRVGATTGAAVVGAAPDVAGPADPLAPAVLPPVWTYAFDCRGGATGRASSDPAAVGGRAWALDAAVVES